MKIGIITWWRYNYGSILQAYALQKELKEMGYEDCEVICQYGKKVVSLSNFKEKLKRLGPKETAKRIIWKFGLRKLRKRNQKIQNFIDKEIRVSAKEYTEENITNSNKVYNCFICGSDQIWNPELTDINSMYWLTFVENNKTKISYAPSIGVDAFKEEQKEIIKQNLSTFKAVSSREESGSKLINEILKNELCKTVLDPTLLVDKKIWDELINETSKQEEKYIFAYFLRGNKKQRKLVEKFAKEKNLKIVSMPFLDNEKICLYDFKFGNVKFWDASPKEFVNLIKNAEYVFTDSFHSMVFSCIYHKEFYTFKKIGKAQINRMYAFQKMINVKDRMIDENYSTNNINKIKKINWENVDDILCKKRKESKKYLSDALNKNR